MSFAIQCRCEHLWSLGATVKREGPFGAESNSYRLVLWSWCNRLPLAGASSGEFLHHQHPQRLVTGFQQGLIHYATLKGKMTAVYVFQYW